jgi:hypothetical protein
MNTGKVPSGSANTGGKMNVGSIFELANRTGLWMFCGVRREDDVSGPVSGRRERVRLYSRPGNDLAKRLDQDEEPRLRGALKRGATIGWGMSMGNTLHSILIRLVAYVAVVIAAGLLFLAGATVYELMWPRPVVPFSQMSRP